MRLKLTLAYDGEPFRGWQSQPGGGTVQDLLEKTMTRLAGGKPISVQGSGRTDAGVHALGQVAHADVPEDRGSPSAWKQALNAVLPPQVRVIACVRGAKHFHARFSATGKVYAYHVWCGEILPPHEVGRCWLVRPAPDMKRLHKAAQILCGKHDFRGFAANRGTPVNDTFRTLRKITVTRQGSLIRLRFEGDGFLYKMVRMLVAALIRVAQERAEISALRARLVGEDSDLPRGVAPADGLYLMRVKYSRRTQTD